MVKKYQPTDATKERLRKAVRDYNRIINKTSKQFAQSGENALLPPTRKYKDIVSTITSRSEMVRELRGLERIKKGKAMDIVDFGGVSMTRYEKQEIQYDIKRANIQRAKERELIKYEKMPVDTENLHERKMVNLEGMTEEQINKWVNRLKKETYDANIDARLNLLRENYYHAIRQNQSKGQADRLIRKLNKMDAQQFASAYISGALPDMAVYYTSEDMQERYEAASANIDNYLGYLGLE